MDIKMKYLVTGGTGYIGSNLIRKLINQKNEVHLVSIKNTNFNYIHDLFGLYTNHYLDDKYNNMLDIINMVKPEIVIHLAGVFGNEYNNIDNLISSNITLGTKILESMKLCGVKKIITTGTHWQNYHSNQYNARDLYAASKEAFNIITKFYNSAHDFSVINLKLFDVYGPNDNRNKLINTVIKSYINNQEESIKISKGEQFVNFIYINDVVEAYLKAIEFIKLY